MGVREFVRGVGAYSFVALAILIAVNVATVIWGISLVYPHMDRHIYLFVITPFITNFAELTGWAFMLYYIFLASAIAASFGWMIYRSVGPMKEELATKIPPKGHSPLYTIGTVFVAVLAFNLIFYFLIELGGASPNTPSFDSRELWQLIYGYAAASVWEEIVSRVLLIGVPLLIINGLIRARHARMGGRSVLTDMQKDGPKVEMSKFLRYILGGDFTIGYKEAALLVFSSAMFGAAHVFSWDVFKIIPAAVAGLAFGYLFLRVGLYASIMLHFAFDFLSVPMSVAPDSILVSLLIGLMVLVWAALGIPYFTLYLSKGLGWLLRRRVWPDVPPKPPQPVYVYPTGYPVYQGPAPRPVPYPAAPATMGLPVFICRACGGQEALYQDGSLTCTRCGTKN